jgi:hypothetical protein
VKKFLIIASVVSWLIYRLLCAGSDYVQRVNAQDVERSEQQVQEVTL